MPAVGDSIYWGFPSSSLTFARGLLNVERFAISVLASVVSEGSPGSSFWMLGMAAPLPVIALSAVTVDRVRGRFAGGWAVSIEVAAFLCLEPEGGPVTSVVSSPEASRDEGWRRSVVEFFIARGIAFLLRLPDPEEEGEDITERRWPGRYRGNNA